MAFEVDFSPIGNLAKTFNEARTKAVRERTLAELGQHFANGNIDYRGLGAKLFALGEPRTGLAALQAAEQREARAEMLRRQNAQPATAPQVANVPPPIAPATMPLAPGPWRGPAGFYFTPTPPSNGSWWDPERDR
jgi:hypothetical protein